MNDNEVRVADNEMREIINLNCNHDELGKVNGYVKNIYYDYYTCKKCGAIAVFHIIKFLDKEEYNFLKTVFETPEIKENKDDNYARAC